MVKQSKIKDMAEDLTLEEAKKLVAKFSNPEHKNKEHELFKVAAAKLLEDNDPGFEYEYEHETEEEVKVEKKELNTFEKIKEYASDVISNVQGLGAAGAVAFSSAAYFQTIEAYETTREIGIAIQRVEADYNQSLSSYIMSVIKGEESKSEESTEEATEAKESETQTEESAEEAESDNNETQQKDINENEQEEKSENEEGSIEANSSETKSDLQTNPVQSETNDSGDLETFDSIKPHSMVGDDAFEPIITSHDASVASPAGPQK